jgi:conjugal transfer pilus assembly protein TraU
MLTPDIRRICGRPRRRGFAAPRAGFLAAGFAAFIVASASLVHAGTTITTRSYGISGMTCPHAAWYETFLTKVCWSCVFPIKVMGVTMNIFGQGEVPRGAADSILCHCDDVLGIPSLGVTAGFWQPSRLIEVVRQPYCMVSLPGADVDGDRRPDSGMKMFDGGLTWGGHRSTEQSASDKTFYNVHYWTFPLLTLLEIFTNSHCLDGGYKSMDLLYMSELDPTWNEDELMFFANPEMALFANPLGMAMCAADCLTTSAGDRPLESLFWCAGCWGNLYPLTGNVASEASAPRDTSLLAARIVAKLHRMGLAWKTYGNDNLCRGNVFPMIPKQQYRMSMMFPAPEADGRLAGKPNKPGNDNMNPGYRCCHYLGDSPFTWGEWRTKPGVGEDYVYMLWRYTDCCLQ